MRFFHLGDLHFGKMVNQFSLIDDQIHVLDQVKDYVREYKPQCILLAGDIFDRSNPPARAVSLYSQFLRDLLIELNTPVLAVAGNHDGSDFIGFGHELFEAANYYVAGSFTKSIKKVVLEDEWGPVNFYLKPFADHGIVRELLDNQEIRSLEDAARAVMSLNPVDSSQRNVLVSHAYVSGGESPELSDSEKKLVIGGKELVPAQLYSAFDYVALGHLHRSQKAGSEKIRYSGSLLKYSFSEEKDQKSVTLVDLGPDGALTTTYLPLTPRRDMRTITGELHDLLSQPKGNVDDYLRVVLTDEGELIEPMAKLRQVYPNIMALELQRNLQEFYKHETLDPASRRQKSTQELFGEFYQHQRNQPLQEAGAAVIATLLQKLQKEEA
jgi:exonuclease SbcD